MEGFSYVDIYATKGIEYLIIIAFLLLVMAFWRYVTSPERRTAVAEAVRRGLEEMVEYFRVPEGRYFHQGHSWAKVESGDVVTVGMDDFAQKLIGKIDSIALPTPGSTLVQGERGWTLDVDSRRIDMLSPVHGEVLTINEEALRSLEIIHQDPYDMGWLMKVRVPKLSPILHNLLSGTLARQWTEDALENLRARIGGNLGVVYQDGGLPVRGIARALDPQKWDEIAKEFLLTK